MKNLRHVFRSAAYVFLEKDDSVLLARRFNTGYKDGQYSTMSGHVEADETITDCAVREVMEEACVQVESKDLKLFHVMTRYSNYDYIDFFFKCTKWKGVPKIGELDLCDDMTWFPLHTLPDSTIDYIREVLGLMGGKTISFSKHGW